MPSVNLLKMIAGQEGERKKRAKGMQDGGGGGRLRCR